MNMALSLGISDDGKKPVCLVVFEATGERLRQTYRYVANGIGHRRLLLVDEVFEEEMQGLQMAGNRFRRPSLPQKMIYVCPYLAAGRFFKRNAQP